MKDANTAASGKRERNRTVSTGSNGKIWVYNIRSNGSKRTRKGGNKLSGGKGEKNRNVFDGVSGGNN